MPADRESVFTLEATLVKFGPGAVADAGWELKRLGVKRALLVTDPRLAAIGIPDRVRESVEVEGIEVVVYDRVRVEPTVDSLYEACDFALDAGVDGFVSVGGGSSIDTAKVANLIVSHPAEVMAYVNPPVGEGRKPPSPLLSHLADPHHLGQRLGGHDGCRARHPRDAGQERHLAPLPTLHPGDRRSRAHPLAPGRGHVLRRPGRGLPRRRVVSVQALRPARAPPLPRRPTAPYETGMHASFVEGDHAWRRRSSSAMSSRSRGRPAACFSAIRSS
jgi:hypothetical protein